MDRYPICKYRLDRCQCCFTMDAHPDRNCSTYRRFTFSELSSHAPLAPIVVIKEKMKDSDEKKHMNVNALSRQRNSNKRFPVIWKLFTIA